MFPFLAPFTSTGVTNSEEKNAVNVVNALLPRLQIPLQTPVIRGFVHMPVLQAAVVPNMVIPHECIGLPFEIYIKRYSQKSRMGKMLENASILKYLPTRGKNSGYFGQRKKDRYRINFRSDHCLFRGEPEYSFDVNNRIIEFSDIELEPKFTPGIFVKELSWDPLKRRHLAKTKAKKRMYGGKAISESNYKYEWVVGQITVKFSFCCRRRLMIQNDTLETHYGTGWNLTFRLYQGLYPSKYRKCNSRAVKVQYQSFLGYPVISYPFDNFRSLNKSLITFGKYSFETINVNESSDILENELSAYNSTYKKRKRNEIDKDDTEPSPKKRKIE